MRIELSESDLGEIILSLEQTEAELVQDTHEQQELSKNYNNGIVDSEMQASMEIKKIRVRTLVRNIEQQLDLFKERKNKKKRNITNLLGNNS